MLDASARQSLESPVSHWTFDSATGRISARDAQGNLLMAIATGPLFGARLAAAFSSPPGLDRTAPDGPKQPELPSSHGGGGNLGPYRVGTTSVGPWSRSPAGAGVQHHAGAGC